MQENIKLVTVKKTVRQAYRTEPIWQYDVGHVLNLEGFDNLPETFQMHYSHSPMGDAITQIGSNGQVSLPDEFAQTSAPIFAWVYVAEDDTGLTKYTIEIPVMRRARITNQEPTPVEQSAIDQAISALNAGVARAETAAANAESSEDAASASAESAHRSSEAAAGAAESAAGDAQTATQKALEAQTASLSADNSATAAAESASAAAASAVSAGGSATAAQNAANTATQKSGEAVSSANSAAASALSAGNAAQTATQKANDATSAATSAQGSASAASGSATAAAGSAAAAAQTKTEIDDEVDGFQAQLTDLSSAINQKVNKPASSPDGVNGQFLKTLGNGATAWDTPTVDFNIATKVFPTVADMVSDSTLKTGDNIATRGYYAPGDNGGNNYVVSSSHTGAFYLTLNNGLYANLLTENGYLRAESIGIKAYASETAEPDNNDMARNVALFETAIRNNVYLLFGKGCFYFSNTVKTSVRGTYRLKGLDRSVSKLYFPASDGITFYTTDYYNYWWFENLSIKSNGDCIKIAENVANLVDCGFEHLNLISETGSCFVAPSYNISKYTSQSGNTVYDTAVQNCAFNYINGRADNGAVFKNIMGMGNQYRHINIIGATLYGFWNCDGRVEDVNTLGTGIQFMFYYSQAYSHSLMLYLIRVNAEGVRGGLIYSEPEIPLPSGEDIRKPTTAHQITIGYLYAYQSGMSLHSDITENHDIYPVTISVIRAAHILYSNSIFNPSAYPSKYDTDVVKANMLSRRALSFTDAYTGGNITMAYGNVVYSVEGDNKRTVLDASERPGYSPSGTQHIPKYNLLKSDYTIGGRNLQPYTVTISEDSHPAYIDLTRKYEAMGSDVIVFVNTLSSIHELAGMNEFYENPGKIYTLYNSTSSTSDIRLRHFATVANGSFKFKDERSRVLRPGESVMIQSYGLIYNSTSYKMWNEVGEQGTEIIKNITGATPAITGVKNTRYMCSSAVTEINIVPPNDGIIEVYFTASSSGGVLKMPRSVKIPSWFDPNNLEANAKYKIRITNGTYGEVDAFTDQPLVNLIDPSTFVDGRVWWNGNTPSGYSNNSASPKIEVTPGKTYILNRDPGGQGYVSWFDENENFISQQAWPTVTTKTIADGVHYIGFTVAKDKKDEAIFAEW